MYKILGTDNKEYGPVPAEQVRQWILQGRANRNTLVQAEGATSWKPLSLFPEFSATLGSVAAAQPAPIVVQTVSDGTNGMAVTSLVCGIVSMPGVVCCCFPTILIAPLGILIGFIALAQLKGRPQQSGRSMAWTGIALSIVALATFGLFMFLGVFAEQMEKWLK